MICWTVNGLGETLNGPCWEDQALMAAFIDYSAAMRGNTPPSLCMITGSMGAPAGQHPKGIVPINGNAKLISANDSSGFTYRGRFDDAAQAATVGYAASQKAHSALRWLVANPSQYRKQLREALSGWKADLPQSAGVVITAFDAATTGRLAVTYYNELLASDFWIVCTTGRPPAAGKTVPTESNPLLCSRSSAGPLERPETAKRSLMTAS